MNFQEILKNKPLLYTIIGVIALILVIFVSMGMVAATKGSTGGSNVQVEKKVKEDATLLTTDNLGKALEIQALLAKQQIEAQRVNEGNKSSIVLKGGTYTQSQRDAALLAIVQSGLMDQFVGLEIFDKGDFTSTKEDKRIRLSRAINGELSRLIRKIEGIENASVFISIPEQNSMFTADKKPITATVQLVVPSGVKLDQTKIKAITNLLLGSVTGLTSENISITDTNGNVYHSLINSTDDQLSRLQENDQYMQGKVASQLDRLLGKGNYVCTVSTFLRQVPIEKSSILYNPKQKTSVSEQTFSEGLGDSTQDSNKGLNAVSVYLPNGLPASGSDSAQNRSYSRIAKETQYGVSKTQVNEYIKPGVVEDISIAVTIDEGAIPTNITEDELKALIAKSASPKVSPNNVSIAYSDSIEPYLASDRPVSLPKVEQTGNPWWIAIALLVGGLMFGFSFISKKLKAAALKQKEELESLRAKSQEQEKQLRDVNLKAAELIERQAIMQQGLMEQQAQQQISQNPNAVEDLKNTITDVSSDIAFAEDDAVIEQVKSWIEKS
ncbi:MAG: flagellar M-ring protein FliF C-terminal domain-containing protein [Candidatus Gastranaerophilales bacterium]|nr:flagellar M-ring protein FliF C-terminal domain-containing protein [Candidatus Gastranaerophilales bacterium]